MLYGCLIFIGFMFFCEGLIASNDLEDDQEPLKIHKLNQLFLPQSSYTPASDSLFDRAYQYMMQNPVDKYPDEITREDLILCEKIVEDVFHQKDRITTQYYDPQVNDLRNFHSEQRANTDAMKSAILGADQKNKSMHIIFDQSQEQDAAVEVIASTFHVWFLKHGKEDYLKSLENPDDEDIAALDICIKPHYVKAALIETFFIGESSDDEDHNVNADNDAENIHPEESFYTKEKLINKSCFIVSKYINNFLEDQSAFPNLKHTYFSLIDSQLVADQAKETVLEMLHTTILDSIQKHGYAYEKTFDLIAIVTTGIIPERRRNNAMCVESAALPYRNLF